MQKGGFTWTPISIGQINDYMGKRDVMGVLGDELFIVEKDDKLPDYIRYDFAARGKWYVKENPPMQVGEVWELKNTQMKVVAVVPNENDPEQHVYLMAYRTFGQSKVDYYVTEAPYSEPAYKRTDNWLG